MNVIKEVWRSSSNNYWRRTPNWRNPDWKLWALLTNFTLWEKPLQTWGKTPHVMVWRFLILKLNFRSEMTRLKTENERIYNSRAGSGQSGVNTPDMSPRKYISKNEVNSSNARRTATSSSPYNSKGTRLLELHLENTFNLQSIVWDETDILNI